MGPPRQGFPAAGPSQTNTVLAYLLASPNVDSTDILLWRYADAASRITRSSFPAPSISRSKPVQQDDDDGCSSSSAESIYNISSFMDAVSVSQGVIESAVETESNDVAEEGEGFDECKDDDANAEAEVVKDQAELDELIRNLMVDDLPYYPEDVDGSMPQTPETCSEYTTWPDDVEELKRTVSSQLSLPCEPEHDGEDSIPDVCLPDTSKSSTEDIYGTLSSEEARSDGSSVPIQSPSYHHIHQHDILTAGYLFGRLREDKTNGQGYINTESNIQDSSLPDTIRTTETIPAMADRAPIFDPSREARRTSNLLFAPSRNATVSIQTTGGDDGNINRYTSAAKGTVFGAVPVQDQILDSITPQATVVTEDCVPKTNDCDNETTDKNIDNHHPTGPISTPNVTNHVDQSVPFSKLTVATESMLHPQSKQNPKDSVSKIIKARKEAILKETSTTVAETQQEELPQEQIFRDLSDLTKFSLFLGTDSSFEPR